MLMLEHDAKCLLASQGVPVPVGILASGAAIETPQFPPPWVAKTQVPTGGRGKAGGIKVVHSAEEMHTTLSHMLGSKLKGHLVREVRIEPAVTFKRELYISLSVDPVSACVHVLLSAAGGIDVEESGAENLLSGIAPPTIEELTAEVDRLAAQLPKDVRHAMSDAGGKLARVFINLDLTLLEINPVFILEGGSWIAGDAKVIFDDNAFARQPALSALLQDRAPAYPDTAFKQANGFDFVILDPEGEIGLVTTGAGLSMKLVDELIGRGARPFNFCDIRTGQMRGDPARLIHVLQQMAAGPNIRAVLVNIFAGITDLSEFASLLITALKSVSSLDVPVVVRLVGNAEEQAAELLNTSGLPLLIEPDLDRAVELALKSGR